MAPSKLAKQTRKDARRDAAAAHQLALWYFRGQEGLSQDNRLALQWTRDAAERGFVDAQATLGAAYFRGLVGVQPVDRARAFAWFRKAALQGWAIH